MIAILEKIEHNIDFHQIVDFIEASHIRYALTINPTIYVSHIRQFWSIVRIKTTMKRLRFSLLLMGDGLAIPTEPHHTPSSQEQHSSHHDTSSQSHPSTTTEPIPPTPIETPTETPTLRDDSQGEAFPTVSSLDAGQDRENINKTSALPYESSPRVISLDTDEGNLEISGLKARVKILEDKDIGREELAQEDALIKGGSMEIGEEVGVERSTEIERNDTEEMVNVLTATTVGVPTVSGLLPTVSAIFTTASVIDAQVAREIKEEFVRDNHRLSEYLARDSEIARIHVEEDLKMMIEGLDRSNEMIAKHLHEYEQAAADLSIGAKIELINELVKYQDHHAKILKYQAQQRNPLSKKEQREFYMSVLRSHAGWKTRHFRGMTLEEIKEKFIPVWK
nr:hypothetical protein [Tanacetum cinerariifolium]